MHAVLIRIEAGQYVDVRRQRDDVVRVRVREDDALGREPIEKRRLHARVAGVADGIGAQRVDGDEDDVGLAAQRVQRRGWLAMTGEDGEGAQEEE